LQDDNNASKRKQHHTLHSSVIRQVRKTNSSTRQNHRRAVTQTCVNGDMLSQWRMAKFETSQIRNPSINRSSQNLKHVITSARRPPVQNFMQIRPLRASRQRGEI